MLSWHIYRLGNLKFKILEGSGTVRSRIGKADEGYGVVVCGANDQHRVILPDVPCGVWCRFQKMEGAFG